MSMPVTTMPAATVRSRSRGPAFVLASGRNLIMMSPQYLTSEPQEAGSGYQLIYL